MVLRMVPAITEENFLFVARERKGTVLLGFLCDAVIEFVSGNGAKRSGPFGKLYLHDLICVPW